MRSALVALVLVASAAVLASAYVPEGYGIVPGGRYIHKDCIYAVREGESITENEDGSATISGVDRVVAMPRCAHKAIPALKTEVDLNGWQIYVDDESNAPTYGSFNGSWTVPIAPASYNNQTLFFFTAFEPDAGTSIIQPVVQYGPSEAGGDGYWGLANWWVGDGDQAAYSNLVQVSTGDNIVGNMIRNPTSGNWTIMGCDTTSGAMTNNLIIKPYRAHDEGTAYVTLEVYSVTSCDEFPTGTINFVNLALEAADFSPITPQWTSSGQGQGCNEKITIVSPAAVTITW